MQNITVADSEPDKVSCSGTSNETQTCNLGPCPGIIIILLTDVDRSLYLL